MRCSIAYVETLHFAPRAYNKIKISQLYKHFVWQAQSAPLPWKNLSLLAHVSSIRDDEIECHNSSIKHNKSIGAWLYQEELKHFGLELDFKDYPAVLKVRGMP